MKKLIAVLIALAMVLSMSVMSFAEFAGKKSPADLSNGSLEEYNKAVTGDGWDINDYVNFSFYIDLRNNIKNQEIYTDENGNLMMWDDAWTAYYDYVLANASEDPVTAVTEIVGSVTSEYVAPGDAITKVGESVMGGIGGDGESGDLSGVVSDIIDQITGGEKQPEVTTEAYVEELKALINSGTDFETISTKISDDIASGKIVVSQLPDIAKGLTDLIDAGEIENNETVQKILEFIDGLGGGEGGGFPSFGDITLPWDDGNSESGNFLDTILGIIGSIGDIFNPDAGDDPATDDPTDPGTDEPTEIPDTGDVSFVAVAAVAAVAGVALVLTRKKHNDAE